MGGKPAEGSGSPHCTSDSYWSVVRLQDLRRRREPLIRYVLPAKPDSDLTERTRETDGSLLCTNNLKRRNGDQVWKSGDQGGAGKLNSDSWWTAEERHVSDEITTDNEKRLVPHPESNNEDVIGYQSLSRDTGMS